MCVCACVCMRLYAHTDLQKGAWAFLVTDSFFFVLKIVTLYARRQNIH